MQSIAWLAAETRDVALERIEHEVRLAVKLRSARKQLNQQIDESGLARIVMTGRRADLVLIIGRLDAARRVTATAAGVSELERTALQLLNHQGTMTAGELARRLALSRGGATALVLKLERAGRVLRVPGGGDPQIVIR